MLKAFFLIVVGLAGDPEHAKTFEQWGTKLAEASSRLGVPNERLVFLMEKPAEGAKNLTGAPTREEIGMAFERFAKEADRKSTRLNSSHGYISYAVFCLKK